MKSDNITSTERRSFLNRFNAGTAAITAMVLGGRAVAQVKSPPEKWEPARHDQDNWMDELPGKHRLVFDTVSNESLGDAVLFGTNFITANRNAYGLQNSDLAIIIIVRHRATGFGFNDAMWAKYGAHMGALPDGEPAPKANPHNKGGLSMDSLSKQGVKFAVCAMATRRIANTIAQASGGSADEINAELIANVVAGGRMVPAGIVAVNRTQERGYTLVSG